MKKNDYLNLSREELIDEIIKLNKRTKYGLVWEDKKEDVIEKIAEEFPFFEENKNKEILSDNNYPFNFIIEGDNYHSLAALNYTHKKKIDVIYIDPPYNTGATDWKYNNKFVDNNDSYRHSKWISMMNNRLRLAKELLKSDGVLICAIDENEIFRLGLLLEQLFPSNEIHCITIVHNPRGIQGKNFSYTNEFAFFVLPKGKKIINGIKVEDKNIKWRNLRDNGGESDRGDAKNCFYPIVVKNNKVVGFGDVCKNNFSPKNQTVKNGSDYYVYPIDPKGVEKKWRYARQSVESIINLLRVKENKGQLEIELGKKTESVKTVWHGSKYDSNEHGKKLINSILNDISFDYPKSIWNVYDCISSIINNKKDAIVLDFFAGSGTTGHAVLKLNEEDNGMRQFILCSNNENNIVSKITYPRVKKIIEGYKDNNTKIKINGIKANLKYFKIDFIDAEYNDRNIANLFSKSTDIICIKENSFNLVVNKKDFKIYKNLNHYTGIIYNNLSISEFKNEISSFNKKINIYIFSLGDDDYSDEFEDIEDKIKIFPLPQSIIKMYKKIYNAT